MGNYIGIDLGTTFSAVAFIDEAGRPKIMKDTRGESLIPSVVALRDSTPIVGDSAKKVWSTDESEAAARFKRDMGSSVTHKISGTDYTPSQLSSIVLSELKKIAESSGESLEEAVITIPANFSNAARDETIAAARGCGLNVNNIVNEPTAAAICYSYETDDPLSGFYVVFDLGGGTFDVSIIKADGRDVDVVASNGLHKLGGTDFDNALWQLVSDKYESEFGKVLTTEEFSLKEAEEVKLSLSNRKRARANVDRDVLEIKRYEFEEAISSYIAQVEMMCEATLDEADISTDQIKAVFLAGGSTRMPLIEDLIKRIYRIPPTTTDMVDEVVALGAALYAAHKSEGRGLSEIQKRSLGELTVSEKTNSYLGTLTLGHTEAKGETLVNSILIHKGESIPCTASESFFTVREGQTGVNCTITESKSPETDPRFVSIIKEAQLQLPPNRPEGQEIQVTFEYDANQIIRASFLDVQTGSKQQIDVSMGSSVSGPGDVEKFVVE